MSFSGSGKVTLSPGLYVLTDNFNLTGSGSVTGANVTILMAAGTSSSPRILSVAGSSTFVLSAARTVDATNGQIPGIVFASLSTGSSTVYTGSSVSPFVGVIYYPNGPVKHTGSSYSGSPGCAELIAYSIDLTGSSTFDASTCSDYGAASFPSVPTKNARLVK